jgi:hypothetical protein
LLIAQLRMNADCGLPPKGGLPGLNAQRLRPLGNRGVVAAKEDSLSVKDQMF